jgi:hypothetical protein
MPHAAHDTEPPHNWDRCGAHACPRATQPQRREVVAAVSGAITGRKQYLGIASGASIGNIDAINFESKQRVYQKDFL